MTQIATYKEFTKFGIVILVLISVSTGYVSVHSLEKPFLWMPFLLTLLGTFLLASGSAALNQIQERKIDAEMPRTSKRPIPSGRLSLHSAVLISGILIGFGLFTLWLTSLEVFGLGALALFSYNFLYTLWWKKKYAFAAIPGALPGALPILMGATAANENSLSPQGIYLFLLLFYWQMPHFWVLAIRYKSDYALGRIPTLPVAKGEKETRFQVTLWTLGYVGLSFLAPLFFRLDLIYFITATLVSLKILFELYRYIRKSSSKEWLRFFLWVNFSLIFYFVAIVTDLWSVYLVVPLTR